MIADLAPAQPVTTPAGPVEPPDVADMAFMWATLNALDCLEVDARDAGVVSASHAVLRRHMDAAGMSSPDMFDYIADAVERGDWSALGLADELD